MRHPATLVATLTLVGVAACGGPPPPPHSVAELTDDPALLQGIVARCAADQRAAKGDVECANARLAVERIAAEEESRHVGERGAEFERQREQRRAQEDQSRRAAERAHPDFDPYTSPVANEKPQESLKP